MSTSIRSAAAALLAAAALAACSGGGGGEAFGDKADRADSPAPAGIEQRHDEPGPEAQGSDEPRPDDTGPADPDEFGIEDERAIEQSLVRWDLSGSCELMTDDFLERQTFLSDRADACAAYESLFVPKRYSAEEIVISDITPIEGEDGELRATAVFGSTIADVTVTYTLVHRDGLWRLDDYDF